MPFRGWINRPASRRLYEALTGWSDAPPMRQHVMSYFRFVCFSAAALVVVACAPLAPPETALGRPEPLIGEAPETTANPAPRMGETERLTALQAQVDAIGSEITYLRKALDVLGSLPDHDDLFIPVELSEITGEPPADPRDAAAAKLAALYAPAPALNRASSLFYEAELGSFASKEAAERQWKKLVASNRLAGIEPRYAAVGSEVRLTAGPLASEAAVDALCVELSALAGACRPVAPIRAY